MWGWRSDKSEVINGYDCKVFSASNVELVTKTRTEHLTEIDKARSKNNKNPLQNFLGIADVGENQSPVTTPKVTFENDLRRTNLVASFLGGISKFQQPFENHSRRILR